MSRRLPCLLLPMLASACGPTHHGFVGTEVFWYGEAQSSPDDPVCELHWSAVGTAIHPLPRNCEGCRHAFEVELTFDEAASTVLEGCEDAAVDQSFGYAWGQPYEDGFTWLYIRDQASPIWQPWEAEVVYDGASFSFTSGYEDLVYEDESGEAPEWEGLYFTAWTDFEAELD